MVYYGLFALQHRGQESAGIAIAKDRQITSRRGMGLVSEVLGHEALTALEGAPLGVGHVRYSTAGGSLLENAQPLVFRSARGPLALGHNGNLTNAGTLRRRMEAEGSIFQTTSDTEVIAHLVARSRQKDLEGAMVEALNQVQGGYAVLVLAPDRVVGVRDPFGIRPLVLGRRGSSYMLASETVAFDAVGGEAIREVAPGEMIVLRDGELEARQAVPAREPHFCVFEYIYFARPDSEMHGQNVHQVRKELGRQLAREAPVDADVVIGVPDSSISAATGYAEELEIPYELGLVKNRYVARTFIQPRAEDRKQKVRLKLNVVARVVRGKRVVLVDDSIVRGTTSGHLVRLLREAGAREVHLRIASPPYRYSCYYGIDTSNAGELVAAGREVPEIQALLGADSLAFLSIPGMLQAVARGEGGHCLACFNGDYPLPVPAAEEAWGGEQC